MVCDFLKTPHPLSGLKHLATSNLNQCEWFTVTVMLHPFLNVSTGVSNEISCFPTFDHPPLATSALLFTISTTLTTTTLFPSIAPPPLPHPRTHPPPASPTSPTLMNTHVCEKSCESKTETYSDYVVAVSAGAGVGASSGRRQRAGASTAEMHRISVGVPAGSSGAGPCPGFNDQESEGVLRQFQGNLE